MPEKLSEREIGFNEGIDAAINYHENICRAGEAATAAARGMNGEDYRPNDRFDPIFKLAMDHRMMGNDLRRLRKKTRLELEEEQRGQAALDN